MTYLEAEPTDGFNVTDYKTTKLVLKRIPSGAFIMGENQGDASHRITLTKPFYMGVFETTQKQWQLVMGTNPSANEGDICPVENVSYDMIRGSSEGAKWPTSNAVDSSSFLGKLRARTGLDFDLPTDAQWEYVCRAGTTTVFSYGDSENGDYMWYRANAATVSSWSISGRARGVGTKKPNPWGFYDMHGNVWEWCLDWRNGSLTYGTDPKGPSSGTSRALRGGGWICVAAYCTSACQSGDSRPDSNFGFRLALTLP